MAIKINRIHYRDATGKLLWSEPMRFKRLWDVGAVLMENYRHYRVLRVALANDVQHVNLTRSDP